MTRTPAPALSPAEAARVAAFDAAPVPVEVAVHAAARAAVVGMAYDWYCASDPTRPRYTCPECIAEIAAAAAIAALPPSPADLAVKRVEALADELGRNSWNCMADPCTRTQSDAANRIRAALASPAPAPQGEEQS